MVGPARPGRAAQGGRPAGVASGHDRHPRRTRGVQVGARSGAGVTPARTGSVPRATKETQVEVELDLDGTGAVEVSTGVPFFDHMLAQLGKHGLIDLRV